MTEQLSPDAKEQLFQLAANFMIARGWAKGDDPRHAVDSASFLLEQAYALGRASCRAELGEDGDAAIQIRFDGPPSHESGRFVDVETLDGNSVGGFDWKQDGEFWLLTISRDAIRAANGGK